MRRARTRTLCAAAVLLASGMTADLGGETKFDIAGRVETVREDRTLTVLFATRPSENTYYAVDDDTVYGTIEIMATIHLRIGEYRFRSIASFRPSNSMYERYIKAGVDICLVRTKKPAEGEYADGAIPKENLYRPSVTGRDGRAMVLVPEGKFMFGSRTGDRDELPERVISLDDFYIDKYEVSNEEFRRFVSASNRRPPLSWEGGAYREGEGDLPVLVTYYEAEAYAKWAGKRLPTEQEWEKAARGEDAASAGGGTRSRVYPWGERFEPERANGQDFWSDEKTGAHVKIRFNAAVKGPMPVTSFDPEGASPCGAVNMAGNVREWTSSWYMPYEGNRSKRGPEYRRYGRQYRVVRGGSWYSPRYRLRTTSREIGGSPSLHTDNFAGFRCVREAGVLDMEGR